MKIIATDKMTNNVNGHEHEYNEKMVTIKDNIVSQSLQIQVEM